METITKVICGVCGKESNKHTDKEKEICHREFIGWFYFCGECDMRLRNCKCKSKEKQNFKRELFNLDNKVEVEHTTGTITITPKNDKTTSNSK